MEQFQFKTNINCGGCINAIKPHFEKINEIKEWAVDTDNPDKILTIKVENLSKEQVIEIVQKAGYTIENI
jgi:copper chaperone CopZ